MPNSIGRMATRFSEQEGLANLHAAIFAKRLFERPINADQNTMRGSIGKWRQGRLALGGPHTGHALRMLNGFAGSDIRLAVRLCG